MQNTSIPMPQMIPISTPTWATDILDEVKQLKSKLKVMESIEKICQYHIINSKIGKPRKEF